MKNPPINLKNATRPLPGLRSARALSLGLILASVGTGMAASNLTWDADLVTPGAQDGTGAWTAAATNFWNAAGSTDQAVVNGDAITFGATTGGFTVNVDPGLSYNTSSLTFAQNYDLSGGSLVIGNIGVNAGKTANISTGLSSSGGTKTWTANAGATLNLSGGGALQNLSGPSTGAAGTIEVKGGAWTSAGITYGAFNNILNLKQSGGTVTYSSNFKVGTGLTVGTAAVSYELSGGTLSGTGDTAIGTGTTTATGLGTGSVVVSGGTWNAGASKVIVGGGGNGTTGGANGSLTVSAGSFTQTVGANNNKVFLATNESTLGATQSTLNVSGTGTVTTSGVQFGDNGTARTFTAGSTATVNVTGGTLNIGSQGISINGTQANLTRAVKLGGGVVGATGGNWSSNSAIGIELTGINGNVTLRAADTDGVTARNITLDGAITGTGGFIKTGSGVLALTNAANTFTGDVLVNAGSVTTDSDSAFGAGNLSVAGGSITLGNFNSISNTGSLSLAVGTTVALSYATTGTETIYSLLYNNSVVAPGTYTASQLNSLLGATVFTSTNAAGNLVTVTAVPEPATWSLMGAALCIVLIARRRAKANG